MKKIKIGIDTGTNTGIAIWDSSEGYFRSIETVKIHVAMAMVKAYIRQFPDDVHVYVEDARKATYGRSNKADYAKAQGAGSIKRDASIWDDFLTDLGVSFEMVRPQKAKTKTPSAYFQKLTGWQGRTSSHARDAALIVFKK
jgi:hypothetical protein